MEGTGLIPPGALSPEEATGAALAAIGGKASGLAQLTAAGLPVPPWFSVPATLAREWLDKTDGELASLLSPALDGWCAPPFAGLAIRSSAAAEDSRTASHAGQFQTVFVSDREQLASAFRRVAGKLQEGGALPVVLQAMLQPELAGVAFSANPAAALPRTLLVEVVQGHGSSLVGGSETPEQIEWNLDAPAGDTARLTAGQLEQLAGFVLKAEDLLECAADVEWCAAAGKLWLLQARPVTAMALAPALLPEEPLSSWFFDQRFPDPISPFTRDTLLPLVAGVALGDALRMRGAPVPETLVHYCAARAYTPLRLFESMLRGAPRWWLSADLRQIFGARGRAGGGLFATLHYAWCAARTVLANFGDVFLNLRAWDRFEQGLARQLDGIPEAACDWKDFEQAWRACDALTQRFLQIHRWSILWADYGHRVFTLLQRLLPTPWAKALGRQLADGVRLPTVAANAALAAWRDGPCEETADAVLRDFADRSASLDYAVPTWAEIVGGNHRRGRPCHTRQAGPRRTAAGSPMAILARLRELREAQRFQWEHILARQRRLVLAIAGDLARRGLLRDPEEVWLLTWAELRQAMTDGATSGERERALRRHEQFLYEAIHPPATLSPSRTTVPPQDPVGGLRGLGASAGIASGPAVLVRNPATPGDIAPGSILVLRALDPACSGIMQRAAGLVVERGGLLSHAAILAREYGVPLVIGVPDAMALLRPGEPLRIDGSNGIVERV